MAEYFHVNDAEANLALIPDGVSDEAACYTTDMMSTGFKGPKTPAFRWVARAWCSAWGRWG
jgi:threonine dehydrogenase-like Zn-dependent dehydrogenase